MLPPLPHSNEFSPDMTQLAASMTDHGKGKAERRVQVLLLLVEEKALRLLCHWKVPLWLCCGVHHREYCYLLFARLRRLRNREKKELTQFWLLLPRELNFPYVGEWRAVIGSLDLWATGLTIATPDVLTNGSS